MRTFKIIEDHTEWKKILEFFPSIDCYYSFEYGQLFAEMEDGVLLGAYFEEEQSKIFYPVIKRKISSAKEEIFDIVTPYGYGGPFIQGQKGSVTRFCQMFNEYCKKNNIITETIRFHPLYQNYQYFVHDMEVDYIRQTTAVDLSRSIEEIRSNYSTMNKRNIHKASEHHLTCSVVEKSNDNIRVFMDLYKETMDRNGANSFYYFNESYFNNQLKDNEFCKTYLLFAKKDRDVLAGVLVFIGKEYAHYHLGASKTEYLHLKPNNLLFDFMIEFCKQKNTKLLHLGGGYKELDGLFKFKTSFTNNNCFLYFMGKKIHDQSRYRSLIESIQEDFILNHDYFPLYRGIQERKLNALR
ncbi:lipid II:glycine glycyltransferase FemX [Heyndrickxia acidicola]|uniref:Lipid II:glycine glycyltransferase n=1 Tax=Heyndrickxia acidicola TaxID=209389 RepID=A0ABU6MKJ6_9BACI|nr:GNAT family N-acetyltransferase [Heyndrickxia acidicola]MED1205201.1 GNAT family N-acetyltransferase [Heyndrickxia acidicola]